VAGRCNASQDAQDAWDAGDASLASGRNADGSDAGSVFADDPPLRGRKGLSEAVVSFVLGSVGKGLGLSTCTFLCIISLPVWGILS